MTTAPVDAAGKTGAAGEGDTMHEHRTFTEAVRARIAQTPQRAALILLSEGDPRGSGAGAAAPDALIEETVTYAELDSLAREIARRLRPHAAAGERVLLVQPSRRLFAAGLLACWYAGVVAVPVAPPGGPGHHDERVAGIAKDAAAVCALTPRALAPEVSQLLARTGHGDITCVLSDGPGTTDPQGEPDPQHVPDPQLVPDPHGVPDPPLPQAGPETVALLQYTSGSTREPRGVIITHGALLTHQHALSEAFGTRPGERIGGWLPFHHDMGLVGQLLHALWLGGTTVLLTPQAFVKRPLRWLRMISDYGLTACAAPDFAYELCVRRVNDAQIAQLDLSRWRTAVSGGEPVRAETLRAFAERFAPAGLRPHALTPAYGLAEATLLVAARPGRGRMPWRTFDHPDGGPPVVSCGPPAAGTEVRIVDPDTGRAVPPGATGEIWVRGDAVAPGYWRRPAETAEVFGVRQAGGGGHLRTGDLGMLRDGELCVTGRLKDMIVVAGRNLYPQDLERTVQQVSSLFGATTVFGVTCGRERVVVVQELRARSRYDLDLDKLAAAVEGRLAEQYEIRTGGVLLVRPGTIRRTTSGKLERAAMRGLFLQGRISPLHQRLEPEIEQLQAPTDTAGAAGRRT
ncbi:fatty acyl-AMP ligase [Streptomyces sp. NPDC051561]|uniref:fatty acyl-AMP ligase n=1 Tax=Streptomyces sp. NPDC051561 TaxID=3365658 RepID=UPI0037B8AE89